MLIILPLPIINIIVLTIISNTTSSVFLFSPQHSPLFMVFSSPSSFLFFSFFFFPLFPFLFLILFQCWIQLPLHLVIIWNFNFFFIIDKDGGWCGPWFLYITCNLTQLSELCIPLLSLAKALPSYELYPMNAPLMFHCDFLSQSSKFSFKRLPRPASLSSNQF